MAIGLNQVVLIGNVGKDPEVRNTSESKEVVVFSFATTESWKDQATGEKRDRTEWHKIVVFHQGIVAIVKKYVKKGSRLYLQGNLQTRKWVDNAGIERYTTEIVLQNQSAVMVLLDSRGESDSRITEKNGKLENLNNNDLDDEIPF